MGVLRAVRQRRRGLFSRKTKLEFPRENIDINSITNGGFGPADVNGRANHLEQAFVGGLAVVAVGGARGSVLAGALLGVIRGY